MESIDVHDLPENEAQVVAAFVEFLRNRQRQREKEQVIAIQLGATPHEPVFSAWPLGVKGTLSREEIYDHL
jgi:hypothetical protein